MITDCRARGGVKDVFCHCDLWCPTFLLGWVVFWEVFLRTHCDLLRCECVTETRSRRQKAICCVNAAACLSEGWQLEGWSPVAGTVVSVASWSASEAATCFKQIFAVGVVWYLLFVWIVDSAEVRSSWLYLKVTIMTSQSGRGVVQRLETGLRDADLVSLRRLLVVQILTGVDCAQDSSSPDAGPADAEGKCKINTDLLV